MNISRIESLSRRGSDPCSSFYETACGGWIESRNITRPLDTISVLDELKLDVDKKIRGRFLKLVFFSKICGRGARRQNSRVAG